MGGLTVKRIVAIYPNETRVRAAELRLRDLGVPRARIRMVAPRAAPVHATFKLEPRRPRPPRFLPGPSASFLLLGATGITSVAAERDHVLTALPVEASLSALAAVSVLGAVWSLGKRGWERSRVPLAVATAVRRGYWALLVRPRSPAEADEVSVILRPGAARIQAS